MHAFARDMLLQHGTDLTDFDIASARPSTGPTSSWQTSSATAHPTRPSASILKWAAERGDPRRNPQPDQFQHNKVARDRPPDRGWSEHRGLRWRTLSCDVHSPLTEQMKKLWTVSRDCCLIQKEESIAGVTCSTVAYKIHKHQVKNGVAPYIYHRPAHGQGWEGHQPPYLALGDTTMLEPE